MVNAAALVWLCVALLGVFLLAVLNALGARMRLTDDLLRSVASCDAGVRVAVRSLPAERVGAFYAYGGARSRAAEEVTRRFRTCYDGPLLIHAEHDAVVTPDLRARATIKRLTPRVKIAAWGSSYASPEDFVRYFWTGLVEVARANVSRVVVLEDDVWMLRPLPDQSESDAWADAVSPMRDLGAALKTTMACVPLRTHAGQGSTVLSSKWILGTSNETVMAAATAAFVAAARWRVPSDAALWAALSCSNATIQTPRWIRTVRHAVDGTISSLLVAPPAQTDLFDDVARGEVALLHKVKVAY